MGWVSSVRLAGVRLFEGEVWGGRHLSFVGGEGVLGGGWVGGWRREEERLGPAVCGFEEEEVHGAFVVGKWVGCVLLGVGR